ncbi:flagellar filament capping protein FliD [Polynucleobacter sp. MWH-UH19D]|uniref:flagellar filament capping protein FliD n=1 Tax=Polynucleobacter sp. MWH-UH19D TaxID=1855610 RepID=UPI0033651D38
MAVSSSSTSTSASTGTASIDVASIVAQLMTVENKPLDAINTKITQQQVVISDLGTVKSKVSALGDALKAFQDPNSYNSAVVNTTDATVVQATAANGALIGSYSVTVGATAQASKFTISGYSSSADLASIDALAGFSITIGSKTYSTLGTPAGTPALSSNATVNELKNWINSLGVNVNASLVQTIDSSHFALMIQGTQTGLANAVSYSGISPSASPVITITAGSAATHSDDVIAFSAMSSGDSVTVNGLTYTASAALTAADVAAKFTSGAILAGGSDYSGAWNAAYTAAASVTNTNQIELIAVATGAVAAPVLSATPRAATNSVDTISFTSMVNGDSVTVNGLTYTASAALTAADVAAKFTSGAILAGGSDYSGAWNAAYTAAASVTNTNKVVLTAATAGAVAAPAISVVGAVVNPSSNFVIGLTAGVVSAPSPSFIAGTANVTESADVAFHDLTAGQSITMGGLTFTAGALGAHASDVASAFASISVGTVAATINTTKSLNDARGGTFTAGSMTGWATGGVNGGAGVTFASATANQDVANLTSSGSAGGLVITTVSNARDASFNVNGTDFTRSSNAVSDVIGGVTLNLVKSSGAAQVVNVTRGADNSQKTITSLIAAYNDLIGTYKTMTANSNNSTSSKVGTFANSPTTLSFINDIKSKFAIGATYGSADPVTGKFSTLSMNAMGMDLQLDGTIKFNAAAYSLASSKGLQDILAAGVRVGGSSAIPSTAPSITTTQGSALATETAQVVFASMMPGQTLTMAGLTFKAGGQGATAAQVATAFSSINAAGLTAGSLNVSKSLGDGSGGSFTSGTSTAWTTAAPVGNSVIFTSTTVNTDVADLVVTQTAGVTDLLAFVNAQIGANGAINSQIKNEVTEGNELTKRQAQLTERLNVIQNNFIAQYSALNALLYQLSSTSTALTSALTALTNSQSSKN